MCCFFLRNINFPLGIDCAFDFFRYLFAADLIQELLKNWKEESLSFKSTFRNKDDVFSQNNLKFGNNVKHIYPIELGIQETFSSACIYVAYIFQFDFPKLSFLLWFPLWRVIAFNKAAIELIVPSLDVEIIHTKILRNLWSPVISYGKFVSEMTTYMFLLS